MFKSLLSIVMLAVFASLLPAAAQAAGLASRSASGHQTTARDPATSDSPAAGEATGGDSIGAIVNSDIIADYDLRQRVALYVATAGVEPTPEVLKKIRAQILDQLVTEKLEIQEAKRKNITISSPEIDKAIDHILTDNHITLDQLKAMLSKNGVGMATLRSQIAAQVLWQKVVEEEFQDRINISDADVDAEMTRLAEGKDKAHFLVSEIFLAVDTPDQDAKVQKNIQDLSGQLQSGAPFQVMARQFSQSPSAASGGDIGWVYDGQLAPELNAQLEKMSSGSVSAPIRSTGGYYILALRERQEASNAKLPDPVAQQPQGPVDKLPLARLLLPLGPKPAPGMADKAMKFATQLTQRPFTCAQLEKIAVQIHGQYQNMGNFRVKDLSEQIQAQLEKSQPGQAVPPFVDAAGVEIIYRCDKAIPKLQAYHMPTRKEVEESLFDQQVTAFARRYMRDLRRQADVEIR
ncbi:MAG: peptidylprolyl isomerase [Alphaproteobacteria bacterium]|nr:peptidylprolyl isomerase [Alphaproteobacteria bacterium]